MNPQQQQNSDHTSNFFWLIAFISGGLIALWWFEHRYITWIICAIRSYEIIFIEWVVHGIDVVLTWFHYPDVIKDSDLGNYQSYINKVSFDKVDFETLSELSAGVGLWLRWPIIIVLSALACKMFFRHRESRFKKIYDMASLKKAGHENWVQTTPVLSLNLLKEELDEGPWAMAKLPMDFCKSNDLLELTEDKSGKKIWTTKKAAAERAFIVQMGPLWRGVQAAPIHVKALVVVFLARIHRENEISEELLTEIAASANTLGKLNFSNVETLLKKYEKSKALQWAEARHAYVGTVMATLLQMTRAEGVFASAEFLWLKPVDRRLWYILNSVGRQTVVVEAAGLFAHWLAEKSLKRPLKVPMVKEAVNALEVSAQDVLYIPEGEKWHINNAA